MADGNTRVLFATSVGPNATTVAHTFSATGLIEERATGAVIRSAILRCHFVVPNAVALTAWTITVTIDGVSASVTKTGQTMGTGSNSYDSVISGDFTALLEANWDAVATETIDVSIAFTGPNTADVSCSLDIGFTYDPASCPRRTWCGYIPINARTSALTGTLSSIGTLAQLQGAGATYPLDQMDGWAFHDAAIQFKALTGYLIPYGSLEISVDGAAATTFWNAVYTGATTVQSEVWIKLANVSAAHAFTARVTSPTGSNHYESSRLGAWVVGGYDATTDTIAVSYRVGFGDGGAMMGYDTDAAARSYVRPIHVPEVDDAADLTMGPCAAWVDVTESGVIAWGARLSTVRRSDGGALHAGASVTGQTSRLDGTGSPHSFGVIAGAGFALGSGVTDVEIRLWGRTAGAGRQGVEPAPYLWINYLAPTPAAGPHVVTRTRAWMLKAIERILPTTAEVREARYWKGGGSTTPPATIAALAGTYRQDLAIEIFTGQNTTAIGEFLMLVLAAAEARVGATSSIAVFSGHNYAGFQHIRTEILRSLWAMLRRWVGQPFPEAIESARIDPALAHELQYACGNGNHSGFVWHDTYHQQTETRSITVTGGDPLGSGAFVVDLIREDTGEVFRRVTTVAGAADVEVPRNWPALYARTWEGDVARSSPAASSGAWVISLAATGGGGGSSGSGAIAGGSFLETV